jgi:cation diffusion facilitator CzcD-associated flavoprotein CzcO
MTEAEPSARQPAADRLLDVVVVGDSQAGLAMAWHLTRHGLRFVVLEAGARTWRWAISVAQDRLGSATPRVVGEGP